jgi:hypothetical protein
VSRRQEFVELVRGGDLGVAIRYARMHLAQWAEAYEAEHQRACALLAFSGTTGCSRYAGLLDDSRWGALVRLFHGDLFRLHSMPPVSLLNVHLQVCRCASDWSRPRTCCLCMLGPRLR